MLIETVELDLANVGLGGLDEVSLLRIYAATQARALVAGTGHTLRDILNADGVPLYPAFYRTRVHVPPPCLLGSHRTWDRVDVGVDLCRFGSMLLEARGVVSSEGTLPREVAPAEAGLIAVEGSMSFVREGPSEGSPRPDSPREGAIASLPLQRERPRALDEIRRVREQGLVNSLAGQPQLRGQVRHRALLARDLQADRAFMFSAFTTLFETGEQLLLLEQLWPPFSPGLLSFVRLVEREVFYLSNVRQGDTVVVDTVARLAPCPSDLRNAYEGHCCAATLDLAAEVHHGTANTLLAAARTRKLFVVPRERANDFQDVQRMLHHHGGPV
jgi:probable biosynthetic protein (TIGR04098 family)